MKVLFLDIDGVLNHELFYEWRSENKEYDGLPYPLNHFDPYAVGRLNRILDETGAVLVVSSSWRFDEGLGNIFAKVGITHPIYGITPSLKGECRGAEIREWLSKRTDVENYAILDDDSDMLPSQQGHFIRTDWWDGLTETLADKAIGILNNKKLTNKGQRS